MARVKIFSKIHGVKKIMFQIVRAQRGLPNGLARRPGFSESSPVPANWRHDFSLPDISWRHSQFSSDEYLGRLNNFRNLVADTNQIPGILKARFTADKLVQTLSILTTTFSTQATPLITLADLEDLRIGAQTMTDQGLFGVKPDHLWLRFQEIRDYSQLTASSLKEILFYVDLFQSLPEDWHDFLRERINLLFLPSPYNPHRVRIQVVPREPKAIIDDRYFDFYRRLAEARLPGIFDVTGDRSLRDAFLGYYDLKAAAPGATKVLFPQYALPEKAARMEKMQMSKAIGRDEKRVQLASEKYGEIFLFQEAAGPVTIKVGEKEFWPTDAPEIKTLFERLVASPIGPIEVDLNLLEGYVEIKEEKPLTDFDQLLARERQKTILDAQDQIDPAATGQYQKIVEMLDGRAIILRYFPQELQPIIDQLGNEERNFIALAIFNYAASRIALGQLADLAGLTEISQMLHRPLLLDTQAADQLRFFYENVPLRVIRHLKLSRYGGQWTLDLLKMDIEGLRKDSQDHSVTGEPILTHKEKKHALVSLRTPEEGADDPEIQRILGSYARDLLQSNLEGITVTDEVVENLMRLGEIFLIMHGRNALLEQIEPQLAIGLTRTLEGNTGLKLPRLRTALSFKAQGQLKELEDKTSGESTPFLTDGN